MPGTSSTLALSTHICICPNNNNNNIGTSNSSSTASSSSSSTPAPARVPRPRNAFILYRQHHHAKVVASNPGKTNPEISKIIGEKWRSLSAQEKEFWIHLGDEEKKSHLERFPDYRYQPRRSSKKGPGTSAGIAGAVGNICPVCKGIIATSKPDKKTLIAPPPPLHPSQQQQQPPVPANPDPMLPPSYPVDHQQKPQHVLPSPFGQQYHPPPNYPPQPPATSSPYSGPSSSSSPSLYPSSSHKRSAPTGSIDSEIPRHDHGSSNLGNLINDPSRHAMHSNLQQQQHPPIPSSHPQQQQHQHQHQHQQQQHQHQHQHSSSAPSTSMEHHIPPNPSSHSFQRHQSAPEISNSPPLHPAYSSYTSSNSLSGPSSNANIINSPINAHGSHGLPPLHGPLPRLPRIEKLGSEPNLSHYNSSSQSSYNHHSSYSSTSSQYSSFHSGSMSSNGSFSAASSLNSPSSISSSSGINNGSGGLLNYQHSTSASSTPTFHASDKPELGSETRGMSMDHIMNHDNDSSSNPSGGPPLRPFTFKKHMSIAIDPKPGISGTSGPPSQAFSNLPNILNATSASPSSAMFNIGSAPGTPATNGHFAHAPTITTKLRSVFSNTSPPPKSSSPSSSHHLTPGNTTSDTLAPAAGIKNNSFSFSHNNVPINNIISEEETWYKRRRTSSYHDPLMVPVIYGTSISGPSGNNSLGVSRSERYKSAFSLAGSHRSILNSNEHPDHLSAINEAESSRQSSVSSNQTSEPNSHQGTVPAAVVERTESISNGQNGREIIRSSLSKFGSFGSVGSFGSFGPFGFGSFSEHGERSSSFLSQLRSSTFGSFGSMSGLGSLLFRNFSGFESSQGSLYVPPRTEKIIDPQQQLYLAQQEVDMITLGVREKIELLMGICKDDDELSGKNGWNSHVKVVTIEGCDEKLGLKLGNMLTERINQLKEQSKGEEKGSKVLENLTAVDLVNLGKALTQLNSQTSAVTVKRDSDVEMLDESPIKIEPGTEDDRFVVPSWITSTSAARLFKVAALEQFVTESIRKANSEINNNEKLKVKKSMKIAAITNNSPVEETPAANLHDIKRENVEDSSPKSSSFSKSTAANSPVLCGHGDEPIGCVLFPTGYVLKAANLLSKDVEVSEEEEKTMFEALVNSSSSTGSTSAGITTSASNVTNSTTIQSSRSSTDLSIASLTTPNSNNHNNNNSNNAKETASGYEEGLNESKKDNDATTTTTTTATTSNDKDKEDAVMTEDAFVLPNIVLNSEDMDLKEASSIYDAQFELFNKKLQYRTEWISRAHLLQGLPAPDVTIYINDHGSPETQKGCEVHVVGIGQPISSGNNNSTGGISNNTNNTMALSSSSSSSQQHQQHQQQPGQLNIDSRHSSNGSRSSAPSSSSLGSLNSFGSSSLNDSNFKLEGPADEHQRKMVVVTGIRAGFENEEERIIDDVLSVLI